jgi:hypothetical protein
MSLNRLLNTPSFVPNDWSLPSTFSNLVLQKNVLSPSFVNNYLAVTNPTDFFAPGSKNNLFSANQTQNSQSPMQARQDASQRTMDAGEQAYRRNDFSQAIALFSQAITQDPRNVAAYNKRGVARAAIRDNAGAISDYTMAIALAPNFYNAYLNRGNLWVYANDPQHALADYGQAIRINPRNRAAYENRSELYSTLGRHDLSLADRATVIQLQQSKATQQRTMPATYPQRLALVLANDDYSGEANDLHGGPLTDAEHMTQQLRQSGFTVITGFNLTGPQTRNRVKQFVETLQKTPGAVSLVYYSGHGGSIQGNNYLIPVNYDGDNADRVLQNAVSVDYLLQQLKKAHSAFNMIFLDACRTPLDTEVEPEKNAGISSFLRSVTQKPLTGGESGGVSLSSGIDLKKWETEPGPGLSNTWIEYASRPDTAALQEDGQGIYTKYLLKCMAMQPGLNLEEVSMYTNFALEQDPDAIAQNQHARTQTDLSHTERLAESFYFNPPAGLSRRTTVPQGQTF